MNGRVRVGSRPAGRVEWIPALTCKGGAKTPATLGRHGGDS